MKKILSIEIHGSAFYTDMKLSFSNKLNCIMGGRGTGKTTLLYFIKAALEQDAENNKNVYSILKDNLQEGKITIQFQTDNGQIYEVTKTFNDPPQITFNGNHISSEKFDNEVVCDFYEAQAIEEIGRNGFSRLQLLDKKISGEVNELMSEIKKHQIDAKVNAQEVKTYNLWIKQKQDLLLSFDTVDKQFQDLKNEKPKDFSDANSSEFEAADKKEKIRISESRYISRLVSQTMEGQKAIDKLIVDSREFLAKNIAPVLAEQVSVINKREIQDSAQTLHDALKTVIDLHEKATEALKSAYNKLNNNSLSLEELHESQQAEFVKFKQSFETNKEYINKYNTLSKKLDESNHIRLELDELIEKRNKLKASRVDIINGLNLKKQQLFNLRLRCAKEINAKFDKSILINLSYGGLKDEFDELLRQALRGSGLRYNELIPRIVQNFSPDQFGKIVHSRDIDSLKTIAGIDESRSQAIIDNLSETDYIYEIETIYTPDLPDFLLRIRKNTELVTDNYKKSDLLSMGQRCTAVLPIIFSVSDNPLIIDQPEDNLDNKYISESIHEIIRSQKQNRQLIFITHNPNIPVLSEAEQNVFLTYDKTSEIENQGTVEHVKTEIINLLEGGEKAFKLRKETYGY